jgi:hypothetical protein
MKPCLLAVPAMHDSKGGTNTKAGPILPARGTDSLRPTGGSQFPVTATFVPVIRPIPANWMYHKPQATRHTKDADDSA